MDLPARALLFDMDGTLVDSDAVVARQWGRWATAHGMELADVLRIGHGRQAHATMAELLPERPMAVNLAEGAELLAREAADVAGLTAVPGAAALLSEVAWLPHALVTSADLALARVRMRAAGLPMPPTVVTAESVGASKPDPEGFLKAAAELGVDPADCVVFEDSAAGIAAGRAAGMRVVGVGARAAAHAPDALVADLAGVRAEPLSDGDVRLTLADRAAG